ncbi:MAG: DUF2383 domain-containing protein [Chthoniobacterales bacterium]
MSNTEHCIDICNKLLRGERSAIATYDLAIEKFNLNPSLQELKRIRDEHASAVTRLEGNVRSMGGDPSDDSGAWGSFATVVQSTANFIGEESAVASLKNGEIHGKNDYEEALNDDLVMEDCKAMMRTELLPKTVEHIATLETLQKMV